MDENVGVSDGISMKKQTIKEGKVEKTTFFFPDLDVSVEAMSQEEARKLAESMAKGSKTE